MGDDEILFCCHWCQKPLNLEDVVPLFGASCCSYVAACADCARAVGPTADDR